MFPEVRFPCFPPAEEAAARGPLGVYVHGEASLSSLVLIILSHLSAAGPEVPGQASQRGDSVLMLSGSQLEAG